MPLTSFILMSILFIGIMVIAISIFVFVRQQQRTFHKSHHHKKSSAASTTSASSSSSSTAIPSLNGKSHHRHSHLHHPSHHTLQSAYNHQHHLIMSNGSNGGATTASINHLNQQSHHHHSASSQSNIYAALVSPSTGSTAVPSSLTGNNNTASVGLINVNNNNPNSNNLYSNSSTTASHHSSSSHNVHAGLHGSSHHWPPSVNQFNQSVYHYSGMNAIDNPYVSSQAFYKTSGSLYNTPSGCHEANLALGANPNDWIKLPKVKQFMSKLVNKSLALSGYRSCSRDELSGIASDKIYDAFISYDKRDEDFVMRHLSAELEHGHPQYR